MELLFIQIKTKSFFDVVQPNKDMISSNLSAGTLSLELSGFGEKIFRTVVHLKILVKILNT